jgi:hypothetical protein
VIACCAFRTHFRRLTSEETEAPARAPRHLGPCFFRNPALEIKTVSKIEQRRAAEYDRVAADALADLRHPEMRRPRCVTRVEAVLLMRRPPLPAVARSLEENYCERNGWNGH